MSCDGFRMILQSEENKGVKLTGHVCMGSGAAECRRRGVSGEKSTPAYLGPRRCRGTALRNLKGERNSRVRSLQLPGSLASRRAPCEVLGEGPVPGRRLIPLPSIG